MPRGALGTTTVGAFRPTQQPPRRVMGVASPAFRAICTTALHTPNAQAAPLALNKCHQPRPSWAPACSAFQKVPSHLWGALLQRQTALQPAGSQSCAPESCSRAEPEQGDRVALCAARWEPTERPPCRPKKQRGKQQLAEERVHTSCGPSALDTTTHVPGACSVPSRQQRRERDKARSGLCRSPVTGLS